MAGNTSWVFVDDRDVGITYGPPGGTIWHGGVSQEYDQTTTGLNPGDTLTYLFNASSIGVFGTYGPTGNSSPPIAVYQVDNTPATTVTAPIVQSTLYRQDFWTSDPLPSLAPGAFHTLVVTATAPNNILWVDYLAYPPTTSGDSTTSASSTGTLSTSTTLAPTTSFIIAPTNTAGASGTSNTKTNIGATVAGIVVGVLAFILAVAALVYVWRRRSRPTAMQGEIDASPNMSYSHTVTPYHSQSEDTPSYSGVPQVQVPRPLPSIPVRTLDGGVSLMGGPLEIPPEYQEHY